MFLTRKFYYLLLGIGFIQIATNTLVLSSSLESEGDNNSSDQSNTATTVSSSSHSYTEESFSSSSSFGDPSSSPSSNSSFEGNDITTADIVDSNESSEEIEPISSLSPLDKALRKMKYDGNAHSLRGALLPYIQGELKELFEFNEITMHKFSIMFFESGVRLSEHLEDPLCQTIMAGHRFSIFSALVGEFKQDNWSWYKRFYKVLGPFHDKIETIIMKIDVGEHKDSAQNSKGNKKIHTKKQQKIIDNIEKSLLKALRGLEKEYLSLEEIITEREKDIDIDSYKEDIMNKCINTYLIKHSLELVNVNKKSIEFDEEPVKKVEYKSFCEFYRDNPKKQIEIKFQMLPVYAFNKDLAPLFNNGYGEKLQKAIESIKEKQDNFIQVFFQKVTPFIGEEIVEENAHYHATTKFRARNFDLLAERAFTLEADKRFAQMFINSEINDLELHENLMSIMCFIYFKRNFEELAFNFFERVACAEDTIAGDTPMSQKELSASFPTFKGKKMRWGSKNLLRQKKKSVSEKKFTKFNNYNDEFKKSGDNLKRCFLEGKDVTDISQALNEYLDLSLHLINDMKLSKEVTYYLGNSYESSLRNLYQNCLLSEYDKAELIDLYVNFKTSFVEIKTDNTAAEVENTASETGSTTIEADSTSREADSTSREAGSTTIESGSTTIEADSTTGESGHFEEVD